MLQVGQTIAGYEIAAELKSGGMATLYLGKRAGAAGFEKYVAIKVIHPHLAKDESFVRMFLDEARLSARFEHPNCVAVHDLGQEKNMYFMVMEYVNGCALVALVRELRRRGRKLSPELSAWISNRVAAGLHAAHEATDDHGNPLGVVHRDVSPQNVLLAYKGYVKLIDFGIAKAAGRSQQTATGLLKGKFRYMSPEQAAGKPVDRRTDVYALGIVTWELLTMHKLFDADNDLALLDQVRNPQIQPPSAFAPEISPALDAAVMRALAPRADDRPASAHAFGQLLSDAVPASLNIDTMQLSKLLRVVMSDSIQEDRKSLPESVSGVLLPSSVSMVNDPRVVDDLTSNSELSSNPTPTPTPAPRPLGGVPVPVPPVPVPQRQIGSQPMQVAPGQQPIAMAHGQYTPQPFNPTQKDSAYPQTMILNQGAAAVRDALPDSGVTPAPGNQSGVHAHDSAKIYAGGDEPIAATKVLPAAHVVAPQIAEIQRQQEIARQQEMHRQATGQHQLPPQQGYDFAPPKKSNLGLIIGAAFGVLLFLGGGGLVAILFAAGVFGGSSTGEIDEPPEIGDGTMVETTMTETTMTETTMTEPTMAETTMVETTMVETTMEEPVMVEPTMETVVAMVEPEMVEMVEPTMETAMQTTMETEPTMETVAVRDRDRDRDRDRTMRETTMTTTMTTNMTSTTTTMDGVPLVTMIDI